MPSTSTNSRRWNKSPATWMEWYLQLFPPQQMYRRPKTLTTVTNSKCSDHWVIPHNQTRHARTTNGNLILLQAPRLDRHSLFKWCLPHLGTVFPTIVHTVYKQTEHSFNQVDLLPCVANLVMFLLHVNRIRDTRILFTKKTEDGVSIFITTFSHKWLWHLEVIRKCMSRDSICC